MSPQHPDQPKIDARIAAREGAYQDDQGVTVVAGKIPGVFAAAAFEHDPAQPTHLDLDRFVAWRRSKCKPRDYNSIGDRHADLTQATLELVGEVGELGELLADDFDEIPASLVDECGDVLFCASWLGDAWGGNPMLHPGLPALFDSARMPDRARPVKQVAMEMLVSASLLANSAKKVLCQGRGQDIRTQADRIADILYGTALILNFAGRSVPDALARNIEKLDARFPVGQAVPGGGIRTGKGA